MAKVLRCRDVGSNCDEVIRGNSALEVLIKAAQHAASRHPEIKLTPEVQAKAKAAIHDEDASCSA